MKTDDHLIQLARGYIRKNGLKAETERHTLITELIDKYETAAKLSRTNDERPQVKARAKHWEVKAMAAKRRLANAIEQADICEGRSP